METLSTVAIALIVAFSTLGATFLQNRYSNKRLERELERTREVDGRQRRREVEGEPLLKLRNELARMATKRDRLLASRDRALPSAHEERTQFGMTKEDAEREQQESRNDWNAYLASGDLPQILFLQYDTELINKVEEIRRDSWLDLLYGDKVRERNKARVIEVQSLINQLLKEL